MKENFSSADVGKSVYLYTENEAKTRGTADDAALTGSYLTIRACYIPRTFRTAYFIPVPHIEKTSNGVLV